MKKGILTLPVLLAAAAMLLQACGQDEAGRQEQEQAVGSFAAAASMETTTAAATGSEEQSSGQLTESGQEQPALSQAAESVKAAEKPAEKSVAAAGLGSASKNAESGGASAGKAQTGAKEAALSQEQIADKSGSSDKSVLSASGQPKSPGSSVGEASTAPESGKGREGANKQAVTEIGWGEFFDGEDQTTPSERFWDLSGSTVTIRGFMGEVLSFENNWFLLIPKPGAECPFDNGDETYWNKIIIVFVPDDVKLRYKSEALQITGRLDVGIKIDESGYKTMFRLYDASFNEIKE